MMSPATWQRAKALYSGACELPEQERIDFVLRQGSDDPTARDEAIRLLKSDQSRGTPVEFLRLSPPGRLTPGQLLAGRYLVRRFVASGGFGEVYEAEDRDRAEAIALKIFRREFASSEHVAWLRREVELARRVRHPNVCRVFDLVIDGGLVFLTMEFLPGETLAAYLKREGALTERRALPLVRQIVAGLAAAHEQGVVHRDLKPGNVMIVPRPDGPPRAVITDFGTARVSADHSRNTTAIESAAAFGTPAYMAPEQVAGEPAGKSADIYSLGVVLHEMLTGELPFSDESPLAMAVRKTRERPASPRRFAPALRSHWEQAILRCLEPVPARRFDNVNELLLRLSSRTDRRELQRRVFVRAIQQRWQSRAWRAAASIALAVVIALIAWTLWPRALTTVERANWEHGLFALHAGEPLEAIRHWEKYKDNPRPERAPIDAALAWDALGFADRAASELSKFTSLRATPSDRAYAAAARAWIGKNRDEAKKLLLTRAQAESADAFAQADAQLWAEAASLRPDHAGAHLQLAEIAAAKGAWPEAERLYLAASAYFEAANMTSLARAVASRRGLRRLAAGNADQARLDLTPGAAIPGSGAAACERYVVLAAGEADGFQRPFESPAYLSPRFEPILAGGIYFRAFDQPGADGNIAVSFPLPSLRFCSARLQGRMRRHQTDGGWLNDTITVGAAPFNSLILTPQVQSLWSTYPDTADTEFTMEISGETLAGIQRAYANDKLASLDVLIGDDTEFDSLKLTLVY